MADHCRVESVECDNPGVDAAGCKKQGCNKLPPDVRDETKWSLEHVHHVTPYCFFMFKEVQ